MLTFTIAITKTTTTSDSRDMANLIMVKQTCFQFFKSWQKLMSNKNTLHFSVIGNACLAELTLYMLWNSTDNIYQKRQFHNNNKKILSTTYN